MRFSDWLCRLRSPYRLQPARRSRLAGCVPGLVETLEDRVMLAANIAPVNSVPTSAQQVTGNLPFAFTDYRENLVSISDADAGENPVEVTLAATHGVLTLITPNPNDGLTYTTGDGFEDPELTFTGTIADINEALAWLTYTPTMLTVENGHAYEVIPTDALDVLPVS